jgi:hypothetical protein
LNRPQFRVARQRSQDGHWLLTGGADNFIRIWDLQSPDLPPVWLRGHEEKTKSIFGMTLSTFVRGISPDGRWLITQDPGSLSLQTQLFRFDDLLELAREVTGRELSEEERRQFMIPEGRGGSERPTESTQTD